MDDRTPLGRSSFKVPRLGVGVMTWGDARGMARLHPAQMAYGGAHGYAEERRALEASLEAGVDLFDTAAMYAGGASERRLGDLSAGRKGVLIATKFPSGFRFRAEDLPEELEASLARLRRPHIDLYQHHYPGRVSIPDLMNRLADAVEAGKVRAVGVSNYSADQMRHAHEALGERGIPLASNQVEYSLLHRQPETNGVLDVCRELGVTLIAYTPLAGGLLTGKYSTENRPGGFSRRVLPRYRRKGLEAIAPVVGLLTEIGDRYSKTPSQVALRWLIENPVVLPIPGAKNGNQATANAGALAFSLTTAEIDALSEIALSWRN